MILPFEMLAIIDKPNTAMQKYSGGPNICVKCAMLGAANSNTSALNRPPKNEAYSAIVRAFSGLPCCVSG